MEYIIEKFEERKFIYMRRIGEYGEANYELMSKMQKWIIDNKLWNDKMIIFVIAQDDAEITPSNECRCDIGIVAGEDYIDNNNELLVSSSPAGKYAIFEIKNDVQAICKFWHDYSILLKKDNIVIDKARRIIQRYTLANIQNNVCEYCVPIL